MPLLRSQDVELRDLARGAPPLSDAWGSPTGARLARLLGVGGMSSVFLAEVDTARRSSALSPICPPRIAVKIMKPAMVSDLMQEGIFAGQLAQREATALGRIMDRTPPTEFVVGFYGMGEAPVDVRGRTVKLPWLALEYVDGGQDGSSLADRVTRAPDGCDPIRALRLCRGIVEGVLALHDEDIIHRDLKPDNVLIVGPVGDETPKIADCGISKVADSTYTIAALTREYAGSEQWLSRPGEKNPLIGPWTDVHALAAVVWFVLGGEHWCRGPWDNGFLVTGERRSLVTAPRLHPGFAADRVTLGELDRVLGKGASPALPEPLRDLESARALAPRDAPSRFESARAFADVLLPLLESAAARWKARAAREDRATTAFRTTQALASPAVTLEPTAQIVELPPVEIKNVMLPPLRPGNIAFQPDGRALARFGGRLLYLWGPRALPIPVGPKDAPVVAATTFVVRGPHAGFALVGPSHVQLVRPGRIVPLGLPPRASPIEAALGDGQTFAVVTAAVEGDEDSLPELWLWNDESWSAPVALPLAGRVLALSSGPYGMLVVGANGKGTRGRALFASYDGQTTVYATGVQDKPALLTALCSGERLAWAAGEGFVLGLDRGAVIPEEVEAKDRPVVMGLDPVGLPWLVTMSSVMRRQAGGTTAVWRTYYEKDAGAPPLVGITFTHEGARVVDARGGGANLVPRDIGSWQSTSAVLEQGS
ncbi:protein kinase domain-containing protein [Polyangium spumosum]|uniref:Protein kinase n=1 Tax=Polyangium spumosum TaxID=889282 RepID=A0A6N7Q0H9_9BACT|nr:protein kinase [Polyangium spumosum]MRG96676.1 protein kinase [Polyangium spumosum]